MSQQSNCAIAVIGFHVVGHDQRGAIVLRQKWSRGQVEARLASIKGGSDWSRPSALARATIILKIPAPQDFLARRGLGHRIPARIAHLGHVRFYAGSDTAGARHNTSTEFRNIGLAHLSGHRDREHTVLAGWRQVGQMRSYAGLDPAFAGLNAGAQCLDIAGAGLACLLCHCDRTRQQQRC